MKLRHFAFLMVCVALWSCTARYVDEPDGGDLPLRLPHLTYSTQSAAHAVPSADNIALVLSWTDVSSTASIAVEMSAASDFGSIYSATVPSGTEGTTFTFAALNDITIGQLGMAPGVQGRLYMRLAVSAAGKTLRSNSVAVTITPGAILAAPDLTCSTLSVVMGNSSAERLALSLSWTKNGAGVESTVQFSSDASFPQPYSQKVAEGVHDLQLTYAALTKILGEIGLKAGEDGSMYVRVVSSFETTAAYSNSVTVELLSPGSDDGQHLYVSGLSAADPWNFDDYLLLYNADNQCYGGVLYAQSQWGYKFYPQAGNWDFCYTRASGDAMSGTLMIGNSSSENMWKPDPGYLYLFDVSLGGYTYKLTRVTSASYTGLNDDWNLHTMKQSSTDPTVFSATVSVTKPCTYRWQIILNNDWNLKLCASDGYLRLYDEGPASSQIDNGTYTLTVNLGKGTYNFEKQ